MIGFIKFVLALCGVLSFLVLSLPSLIFILFFPVQTQKWISKSVSTFSTILLFILKIKVRTEGDYHSDQPSFIVSNHLSYIDILIISKYMPCLFITSIEMKKTPILGQIVTLAGCLFVERRSRANIQNEINTIRETLENGISITVFPEATSSNADRVLPFKRSLFEAALMGNIPVRPVV